jgi:hypothetical protein
MKTPTKERIPPDTGRKRAFETPAKTPTNKANEIPKQIPGRRVGKSTPRDKPTKPAHPDRTQRATIAKSRPTGTNIVSRKTKVIKPDKTAERTPEKNRWSLYHWM